MEASDQQRITIERFLGYVIIDWLEKLLHDEADDSSWWSKCIAIISRPFLALAILLICPLVPILVGLRLAVAHADRVVFVIASAMLSFYQVPRKVFYIYIAVLAVTGFLQFLRYRSTVRGLILGFLDWISCGTSNVFLRKFTTLHFPNPFNRCFTVYRVIYIPVGLEIPCRYSHIEDFDFPVSELLDFDKIVGICQIKIVTLGNTTDKIESLDNTTNNNEINSIPTRVFTLHAPWGRNCYTLKMKDENLRKLISYFEQVIKTNCEELICSFVDGDVEELSILGTINHFNSGRQLVKLKNDLRNMYFTIYM